MEYLTLNDCFALKGTFLSLDGIIVSERKLLQRQIKSVFLGEKGNKLFSDSLEKICKTLCELLSLNKELNIEDRS